MCIRFKAGTFMPGFLPGSLRDHQNVTLPSAASRSFWLNGSAFRVSNLSQRGNSCWSSRQMRRARPGISCRRYFAALSARALFALCAATLPTLHRRQLCYISAGRTCTKRKHQLLREQRSILDVVSLSGYFDQAHLTRSFRRFIGQTPTKITKKQLSFLYKTELQADSIVLP